MRARGLGAGDRRLEYDPEVVDRWLAEHKQQIEIKGSEDFVARTRADLGVMLATGQGRGLLDGLARSLQKKGESVTIDEQKTWGGTYTYDDNRIDVGQWSGDDVAGLRHHPLTVLFHELVHANQDLSGKHPEGSSTFAGGQEIENDERQAVGLSWRDENGKLHDGEDAAYTENKFRRELGLDERWSYLDERGDPRRT